MGQTPAVSEYCLFNIHDEELFVQLLTLKSVSDPSEPWSQGTLYILCGTGCKNTTPVASFLNLNFMYIKFLG